VVDHSDRFENAPVVLTVIALYGAPEIVILDPIENLVLTILSQNTNDINRDRAFTSLMETFATFDQIRLAPLDEIAAAIQVGGLQQQKSRSIRQTLERIMNERGCLELAFLADLSLFFSLTSHFSMH